MHKKEKLDNLGVYTVNCGSCPKAYMGQIVRTFKTYCAKHRRGLIKEKCILTMQNIIEETHITNEKFRILHITKKSHKLNYLNDLK